MEENLRRARFEGMDAFEAGLPSNSNPYGRKSDPDLHDEWSDGWSYAHFMSFD